MAANLTASLLNTGMLRVEGTEAAEAITIWQDSGLIRVSGVSINTPTGPVSSVSASVVRRIDVNGLGGNDTVRLDQGSQVIRARAMLFGGMGDDYLVGGAADDYLVGGHGNDTLYGGGGNDSLVGDDELKDVKPLLGDIDGDGRSDLVYAYYSPRSGTHVRTVLTNESGVAGLQIESVLGDGDAVFQYPVKLVDANGDRLGDLVFTFYDSVRGTRIRTALGRIDGSFAPTIDTVLGDGGSVFDYPVQVGDVNGDGRSDFIFTFYDSVLGARVRTALARPDDSGTFLGTIDTFLGDGGSVFDYPVQVGDVNGDGRSDFIFTFYDSVLGARVRTALASPDGSGRFLGTIDTFLGDGGRVFDYPVQVGDANGDGRSDLIFTFYDSVFGARVRTALARPDDSGTFLGTIDTFLGDGGSVFDYPVQVGDANGDGRSDLIFTFYDATLGMRVRTALATGDGRFAGTVDSILGDGELTLLGSRDVTGDSRPDLVFSLISSADGGTHIRTAQATIDGRFFGTRETVLGDRGAGNDVLFGGTGHDILLGGQGNEYLFNGNDTLLGEAGNDILEGGAGVDVLEGGTGQDTLFGFAGNDRLFGGPDEDVLDGGPGADLLNGGQGNNSIQHGESDGRKVLYLNFDGANITSEDLGRWGSSDWSNSNFDEEGNGISVQPFLAYKLARETIITGIMVHLQTDLAVFGINVQRTNGLAVEYQGATTIFVGPASLTKGHNTNEACDIDVGNNNLTDIAFVGDEDWGTAEKTALALADVALHEAGHTFGLYHVQSGRALETMGFRYSDELESSWARDTSFRDRTYNILPDHGPSGTQNSYQVMAAAFGTTMLLGIGNPTQPENRLDTNNDGEVSPLDALLVINRLNSGTLTLSEPLNGEAPFGDINNDGVVSPLDALLIINWLNKPSALSAEDSPLDHAEGEASISSADTFFNHLGSLSAALTNDYQSHRGTKWTSRFA